MNLSLFYDERDAKYHESCGSKILYWLDDLGAKPLTEARQSDQGFLFTGARPIVDYRDLVQDFPNLRDSPEDRLPLLQLDSVLDALFAASVKVPTPRTWRLPLDSPLPDDLTFPLFVRTAQSSWKVGGRISRVRSPEELDAEAAELRLALGWDALILARSWHDFAEAGEAVYGPIPQEVRVWMVEQVPVAWSFHYIQVIKNPRGFPPKPTDLRILSDLAREVGRAFRSQLIVADFARQKNGEWIFIEAGPGSCAGTAHEAVFKTVASRLCGNKLPLRSDLIGGSFE